MTGRVAAPGERTRTTDFLAGVGVGLFMADGSCGRRGKRLRRNTDRAGYTAIQTHANNPNIGRTAMAVANRAMVFMLAPWEVDRLTNPVLKNSHPITSGRRRVPR